MAKHRKDPKKVSPQDEEPKSDTPTPAQGTPAPDPEIGPEESAEEVLSAEPIDEEEDIFAEVSDAEGAPLEGEELLEELAAAEAESPPSAEDDDLFADVAVPAQDFSAMPKLSLEEDEELIEAEEGDLHGAEELVDVSEAEALEETAAVEDLAPGESASDLFAQEFASVEEVPAPAKAAEESLLADEDSLLANEKRAPAESASDLFAQEFASDEGPLPVSPEVIEEAPLPREEGHAIDDMVHLLEMAEEEAQAEVVEDDDNVVGEEILEAEASSGTGKKVAELAQELEDEDVIAAEWLGDQSAPASPVPPPLPPVVLGPLHQETTDFEMPAAVPPPEQGASDEDIFATEFMEALEKSGSGAGPRAEALPDEEAAFVEDEAAAEEIVEAEEIEEAEAALVDEDEEDFVEAAPASGELPVELAEEVVDEELAEEAEEASADLPPFLEEDAPIEAEEAEEAAPASADLPPLLTDDNAVADLLAEAEATGETPPASDILPPWVNQDVTLAEAPASPPAGDDLLPEVGELEETVAEIDLDMPEKVAAPGATYSLSSSEGNDATTALGAEEPAPSPEEDVFDEEAFEVEQDSKVLSKGERPSGVDELAESLESGIDLSKEDAASQTEAVIYLPDSEEEQPARPASAKAEDDETVFFGEDLLSSQQPSSARDVIIFEDAAADEPALAEEATAWDEDDATEALEAEEAEEIAEADEAEAFSLDDEDEIEAEAAEALEDDEAEVEEAAEAEVASLADEDEIEAEAAEALEADELDFEEIAEAEAALADEDEVDAEEAEALEGDEAEFEDADEVEAFSLADEDEVEAEEADEAEFEEADEVEAFSLADEDEVEAEEAEALEAEEIEEADEAETVSLADEVEAEAAEALEADEFDLEEIAEAEAALADEEDIDVEAAEAEEAEEAEAVSLSDEDEIEAAFEAEEAEVEEAAEAEEDLAAEAEEAEEAFADAEEALEAAEADEVAEAEEADADEDELFFADEEDEAAPAARGAVADELDEDFFAEVSDALSAQEEDKPTKGKKKPAVVDDEEEAIAEAEEEISFEEEAVAEAEEEEIAVAADDTDDEPALADEEAPAARKKKFQDEVETEEISMEHVAEAVAEAEAEDETAWDEQPAAKKKAGKKAREEETFALEEEAEEAADEILFEDEEPAPVAKGKGKKKAVAAEEEAEDILLGDEEAVAEAEEEISFEDDEADEALAEEGVEEELAAKAEEEEISFGDEDAEAVADEEAEAEISFEEEPAAEAEEEISFEDEEAVPKPAGKKRKAAAVDLEEEVSFEEEEEPAPPPRGKKKGKARVEAEEEEEGELVGAGVGRGKKPPKPKYGRRWLGGMVLGLLIGGGAVVAVKHYSPDLLEEIPLFLPNAQASLTGKNAPDFKDMMSKNAALQKEKAEQEQRLTEAKTKLDESEKNLALLKEAEKAVGEMAKVLKADPKDLPAAVSKLVDDKQKAADEVDAVKKAFVDGKIIADKDKFDLPVLQKVLKDYGDGQSVLATINKMLDGAGIKEPGDKGVDKLFLAKKDIEDKLNEVNKLLTDAKIKDGGAKGVQELVDTRTKLEQDRDSLDQAVKQAFKELVDGNFVAPGGDPRKELAQATKLARQKAESPLTVPLGQLASSLSGLGVGAGQIVQRGLDMSGMVAELGFYKLREPLIQSPEAKLDVHLALLQDRARTDVDGAAKDADWVRSPEAKADPEARAKALVIKGLAQRNKKMYDEARKTLGDALSEAKTLKKPAAWAAAAEKSLKELTDAAAYYLPRVEKYRAEENLTGALDELNVALQVIPNDGHLLAKRSLLRLDLALEKGKVAPDAAQEIRQDAEAAKKDPASAAAGSFALGRLEEELGDFTKAEEHYRQALKAHQGSVDEASRYRVALARLLQRERPTGIIAPPPPPPKPKVEDKVGLVDIEREEGNKGRDAASAKREALFAHADSDSGSPAESSLATHYSPLTTLLVLAITGVQPGLYDEEDPVAAARLKESIELANELIKSADVKIQGQGYMILGQAYAKMGRRSEGLNIYIKGLQLLLPGTATKDLAKMVDEHPAFQQPDTPQRNPYLAEVHYGKGLHHYWSRQYPEAEGEFKAAVGYFEQDPRYQYFLGLARLHQKGKLKRDAAYYAFEQGARLEAQGRTNPLIANVSTAELVNFSLERIQGELRQFVNTFRQKALATPN